MSVVTMMAQGWQDIQRDRSAVFFFCAFYIVGLVSLSMHATLRILRIQTDPEIGVTLSLLITWIFFLMAANEIMPILFNPNNREERVVPEPTPRRGVVRVRQNITRHIGPI